MKKLFTTILMMGVALCGWASITPELVGTTLTINYTYDENNPNELQNFNNNNSSAETIVLTGDWSNKDLQKIGSIVGSCSNNVFLDLSACEGFVSKIEYTGTNATTDWTSNDFKVSFSNAAAVSTAVQKEDHWIDKNGKGYNVQGTPQSDDNGYYTWDNSGHKVYIEYKNVWGYYSNYYSPGNPDLSSWVTIFDERSVDVDPNNSNQGTAMVQPSGTPFSLAGNDFSNNAGKLKGIAFPNGNNFNYIPAQICAGLSNLEDVTFGDKTQWIGENAFANCSSLNDVTFPSSLTVIGIDAFYGCSNFVTVNLDLPNLVRVDAAAFNMGTVSDEKNNVKTVILPGQTQQTANTTLKFWGNQVFSSSNVTSLDFSHCEGIEHFAYDGYKWFGHDEVHQGQSANSVQTFYYHNKLTYISFPPKILYVGLNCFDKCTALQTVVFNGRADYDKTNNCAENKLNNPLIIDEQAFKDIKSLTSVTFSDNITEIRTEAFQATGLTEVHIPASVQVIGVHAFQESKSLSVVYFDEIADDCKPCKHAKTVIAGEHRVTDANGDYVYVQDKDESGNLLFEEDGVTPKYKQDVDPYTGEPKFDEEGNPVYEIARYGDGDGAFFQCPVTDVYINAVGADIVCENKAFDYTVTFGQTDPKANFGTLHYPEGEEEKYVNLSHYLTNEIANTPGLFQKWLQDHFNWATKPNNNGWHEFINSGPSSNTDVPPYGEHDYFLRTFSDPNYARIVPSGIKAYIVNKVEKNATTGNYELTLQQLRVIPAQTGVILFGQPNANAQGGSSIAMTAVAYAPGEGQPLRRDYWDILPSTISQEQYQAGIRVADNIRMKNYLMPIIANANIRTPAQVGVLSTTDVITPTNLLDLKPYEKVNGAVTFRNFALGHITNTEHLSKLDDIKTAIEGGQNYAAFFRVTSGTKTGGYAYLHLDPTAYNSPSGAEILVLKDNQYSYEYLDGSFTDFAPKTSLTDNPNQYWQFAKWEEKRKLWGDRTKFNIPTGKQAVQYLGELEDEADGIVKVVVPATENDDYYTLQGVRVSKPTKGVYIHNGQKVIIK